jgi:hypothetical protein
LAAPRYGRRELVTLALSFVLPLAAVAPIAAPLALGVFLEARGLGPGPAAMPLSRPW